MRSAFSRGGVVGLLAFVACSGGAVAHASSSSSSQCAQLAALRTVFPSAPAAGFKKRSEVRRAAPREPLRERKCGYWWTTYTGFRETQAYVDVSVTLYKTRKDALAGLAEPIGGPVQVLSNGARVRTRVKTLATDSGVVSLVGNVIISANGAGPHDGTYSGRVAVEAWLRIHRGVQAGVLALR